jgi:flagellar biosynthesis regulator FlaF
MVEVTEHTRNVLLEVAKKRKIYVEGSFLKILKAPKGDKEFEEYLKFCKEKDISTRKKRLEVTKQVQQQNKELESAAKENDRVNKQLSRALDEASKSAEEAMLAKAEAEKLRDEAQQGMGKALEDLELMQKKTQFELIGKIVTVALWVILGVGVITTLLFAFTLVAGRENPILESTWSNLFGILLTNSFSIIGTIMGVKYATEKDK